MIIRDRLLRITVRRHKDRVTDEMYISIDAKIGGGEFPNGFALTRKGAQRLYLALGQLLRGGEKI